MKDLMGIMKQAQAMQQKMADIQAELDTVEVEGAAGGGVVKITMTAKGQVKAVALDPLLLNPDEKEILEDLLVAAARRHPGAPPRDRQRHAGNGTKRSARVRSSLRGSDGGVRGTVQPASVSLG